MRRMYFVRFDKEIDKQPLLRAVFTDGKGDNLAIRRFFGNLGPEAVDLRRLTKAIEEGIKPPQSFNNGNDDVSVYIEKDFVEVRNYIAGDTPESEKVRIDFKEFYSLLTEFIEEQYLFTLGVATGRTYRGIDLRKEYTKDELENRDADKGYNPDTGEVVPWKDTQEYQEWLEHLEWLNKKQSS